ncbi:hypothetical protein [Geobacter sulfurreducens]|uniref:hypothetical protein n=1 Tax=Geobacter sulfurreducens TaxID=35554 RepID=UPI0001E34228|nr:hypothetical protein [Geobacter sulfurreducens]ADN78349.1 hypothetical protein KN400_3453 [Geobacter sulfurreducens KN400]
MKKPAERPPCNGPLTISLRRYENDSLEGGVDVQFEFDVTHWNNSQLQDLRSFLESRDALSIPSAMVA